MLAHALHQLLIRLRAIRGSVGQITAALLTITFMSAVSAVHAAAPPSPSASSAPSVPTPSTPLIVAEPSYTLSASDRKEMRADAKRLAAVDCHASRFYTPVSTLTDDSPRVAPWPHATETSPQPESVIHAQVEQLIAKAVASCGGTRAASTRVSLARRAGAPRVKATALNYCYTAIDLWPIGSSQMFYSVYTDCTRAAYIQIAGAAMVYHPSSGTWTYGSTHSAPVVYSYTNGISWGQGCTGGYWYDTWGWLYAATTDGHWFGPDAGYAPSPMQCEP